MQQLITDVKEALVSLAPVLILVIIAHIFTGFMSAEQLIRWIVGGIFAVAGLFIFLRGVMFCLLPLGDFLGTRLPLSPAVPVFLAFALVIAVAANAADPALTILAEHINTATAGSGPPALLIIFFIIGGVGVFMVAALLRIVWKLSPKLTLGGAYCVMLTLALFAPKSFLGLSLDSGGVATGPLTVPFLLALGTGFVGVIRGKENLDDGFGVLGLVAVGPMIGVMLLGMMAL